MGRFENQHSPHSHPMSRRSLLKSAGVVAAGSLVAGTPFPASFAKAEAGDLLAELDGKIRSSMEAYGIPGVAIGLYYKGSEYIKGYGVTNVEHPEPVDGNTLFRVGSTSKTFTGTAVMRLVEAGRLDLDATVRTYLPDFTTLEPSVAEKVTLRHLLNHSPGWLGDHLQDFGPGDDALALYAASMAKLPQLTPLGSTFFYNNAGVTLAGHVIEKVYGTTYEKAVQELVLDPLRLDHSRFFTDELIGRSFAASHRVANGKPILDLSLWRIPRSLHPTGGLISSARDQLSYARFHLGDGRGPDGKPILTAASIKTMRSRPGPGGTLFVELDGLGVTFHLRPSAEGVAIIQHGGDWTGQHSGLLFVPDRDFAFTVLTNSDSGPKLTGDLCGDDWVLSRFAGLHNLPARPRTLSDGELAAYAGDYTVSNIGADGQTLTQTTRFTPDKGRLRMTFLGEDAKPMEVPHGGIAAVAFHHDDYVQPIDDHGNPLPYRGDFLRDETGRVQWFRFGGRLNRKIS